MSEVGEKEGIDRKSTDKLAKRSRFGNMLSELQYSVAVVVIVGTSFWSTSKPSNAAAEATAFETILYSAPNYRLFGAFGPQT